MKRPLMSVNVTGVYDSRNGLPPIFTGKPCLPTMSHSRIRTNSELDPSASAGSVFTWPPNGLLKGQPAEQHLSSCHSAPPPDMPEQAEHDKTARYPVSTFPQPKPTNGYPHDNPLRMLSRHPCPDSPLPHSSNSADVKSASLGSATRFSW